MRRPSTIPTARRYNQTLHRLETVGANTFRENIRMRGGWAKLWNKRRKKAA